MRYSVRTLGERRGQVAGGIQLVAEFIGHFLQCCKAFLSRSTQLSRCLGPLLLVALGFSGAWIGNLTVLEPYRPLFIGAALVAMAFAYRRIYRLARACEPDDVCAVPEVRTTYKVVFWAVAALVLVALAFPYVLPLFY